MARLTPPRPSRALRIAAGAAIACGAVLAIGASRAVGVNAAVGTGTPSVPTDRAELTPAEIARFLKLSPLPSLSSDETNRVADDQRAARLGQFLFFDERLSSDRRFSCASCHDPARAFTDGKPVAEIRRARTRNTPTLFNLDRQRWLNWDGGADSTWAQAFIPLEHPDELDGDRTALARLLVEDPALRRAYERIFGPLPTLAEINDPATMWPARARPVDAVDGAAQAPDPLAAAWAALDSAQQQRIERIASNATKAIAAYLRQLQSQSSPFDRFVERVRSGAALPSGLVDSEFTAAALRGLRLFNGRANCRLCHSGPNFTDGEFHAIGIPTPDGQAPRDSGRFNGVKRLLNDRFNAAGIFSDDTTGPRGDRVRTLAQGPENWGWFRTPSLRDVARTAPYGHAGQFATLHEVVRFYSTLEGQMLGGHHRETILVPLGLAESEVDDLVAFLTALSGAPVPSALLARPSSPGE